MSDFKVKMHEIRPPLGVRPLWELTALPQIPLLYLGGLLLRKGRENRGKRDGRGGEEEGGGARDG